MNLLKILGQALINNIVAVLFLLGLVLVNVATYLQFGLVAGLLVTGVTFILIALIVQFEQASIKQQ